MTISNFLDFLATSPNTSSGVTGMDLWITEIVSVYSSLRLSTYHLSSVEILLLSYSCSSATKSFRKTSVVL